LYNSDYNCCYIRVSSERGGSCSRKQLMTL